MKEKKRYQTPKLSSSQVEAVESQVLALAEQVAVNQYYVVNVSLELENGRWYLRVYADHAHREGPFTLEDCQVMSHALNPLVDEQVQALQDFPYNLEVSSPGLFRALKTPREFQFYQGHRIEIKPKGESPFTAYLHAYDPQAKTLAYRKEQAEDSDIFTVVWDPKQLEISLSPQIRPIVEA